MNIAYVTVLPAYSISIAKKIKEKADIAKKLNLNIDFYYINPDKEIKQDNFKSIKIKYSSQVFLNKMLFKLNLFNNIEKKIELEKYDYIVLRYPLVDSFFWTFINKYGYKIISEHHTNEIAELFSSPRIFDKLRAFNEALFSKYYLAKVRAIIGVTDEITYLEVKKSKCIHIPHKTISNGINLDKVEFTKFKKFDGKTLDIIFVASYFYPWHGLNIILDALENYNGSVKINLNLVGEVSKKDKIIISNLKNNKVKINLLGKKDGKDLDDIFYNSTIAISTIAISTIAISTKKMKQACPLKTREYIARGIPFIYGYEDVDLKGNEKFVFKINPNNLDFNQIIDFANKVSQDENISFEMRDFAMKNLDFRVKLKNLYDFIFSL